MTPSMIPCFINWPSGTNFYGGVIHVIWSHMTTNIFDQSQCIFVKLKGLLFYMSLFFRHKHLIQSLQCHELHTALGMLLLRKTNLDCNLNNFKKQRLLRIFQPVVIGTLLKAI